LVRRNLSLEGAVSYELLARDEIAHFMADFRKNLVTSAADSFIELWDL
jgi:hypothetical protein